MVLGRNPRYGLMEKAEDITAIELMEREDGTGEVDDEVWVRGNGDARWSAVELSTGAVTVVVGTLWTFFFLQYVRAALMDDYGFY